MVLNLCRSNVDLAGEHDDKEIWDILRKLGMDVVVGGLSQKV
jgi:hypothetical protein